MITNFLLLAVIFMLYRIHLVLVEISIYLSSPSEGMWDFFLEMISKDDPDDGEDDLTWK